MTSLLGKIWHERGEFISSDSLLQNFCRLRHLNPSDIHTPAITDLADPFAFQEMQKSVQRIFAAIENKQRILIFGDYDLDGMSGVAQLFLTLKALGADVSFRLPSRTDGYGLSLKYIQEAAENNVPLILTTDCGISNLAEITAAQQQGIDVIITDHHSLPDTLPPAYSFLHPLLPQETFPDKHLTGAGVAFFLCMALVQTKFGTTHCTEMLKQLLEIAVLGTIADCGKLIDQNRILTLLGIEALKNTKNHGLKKLLELSKTTPENIHAESIAFYIAPRLNAAGRLAHPRIALEVILGNPERAAQLEVLNEQRRNMVEACMEQAEGMLEKNAPALIVKHPNWPAGIIGLIAGKLHEKYNKPAIVLAETAEKFTASCRGPEDIHLGKILKSMSADSPDMFLGAGGHAAAAGFSLLPEKLGHFTEVFLERILDLRGENPPIPNVLFDGSIDRILTPQEIEELQEAAPFGIGNPAPLFVFPNMKIVELRRVGNEKKHLSLRLQSVHGQQFGAIFFGQGALESQISKKHITILATPQVQVWNGQEQIQLQVQDMEISKQT